VNLSIRRVSVLISVLLLPALGTADVRGAHPVKAATIASVVAEPLEIQPLGTAQADVTLVEYFDYNCPGCRHLDPELRKLLADDPKVRLIRKDWPVFGDASTYAAYCSYAAAREGKYAVAHDALISSKQDLDSKDEVRQVMRAAGFDMRKIDADIAQHEKEYSATLARNVREATALNLRGTPGLIVGNQRLEGDAGYADLQRWVATFRKHP
jgi:protein-disulfide isomerase